MPKHPKLLIIMLIISAAIETSAFAEDQTPENDLATPAQEFDQAGQGSASCDESILEALNSKTNYFYEGATDAEIARQREGLRQKLKQIFAGNPLEENSDDSEGLRQLKILMQKNEFSSWLRTYDEVKKNLEKPIIDRDPLVKVLSDPQEAFLAKLAAIRNAKYTVDSAYFIFARDEAAYAFLHELKDAIHRGVNIRVLEDSAGSFGNNIRGNPQFKALLEYARQNAGFVHDPSTGEPTKIKATVEVIVYNPVSNVLALFRNLFTRLSNVFRKLILGKEYRPWAETHWNPFRRMHDKLLLIDADFPELAVAVTGGRNIQNIYYGLYAMNPNTEKDIDPPELRQFNDFEVMIRNSDEAVRSHDPARSIGRILTQEFDRLYFHKANRRITEGLIGVLFGRQKYFEKMEGDAAIVDMETADTQNRIDEHEINGDFGKHFLTCGFFDQLVDFVNTANNITRPFMMRKAIHDAVTVPKGPIDIAAYQDPDNKQAILSQIAKYLFNEDEEITFVSPYIWFSPRDIQALYYWLREKPTHRLTVITGSVITDDSPMSQAMVDVAVIPMLLADESLRPQIEVYEYGKCDDAALGGTKKYDLLHMKAAYFKSQKVSLSTTYNKDPLSQFSNSELGTFITGAETAAAMEAKINELKQNSHIWGSDEYQCIRENANLDPKVKHRVKIQKALFWLLDKMGFWTLT
jgi:cardiolipin synthase C